MVAIESEKIEVVIEMTVVVGNDVAVELCVGGFAGCGFAVCCVCFEGSDCSECELCFETAVSLEVVSFARCHCYSHGHRDNY